MTIVAAAPTATVAAAAALVAALVAAASVPQYQLVVRMLTKTYASSLFDHLNQIIRTW